MNIKEMSSNHLFYTILTFNAVTGNEHLYTSSELHAEYNRRLVFLDRIIAINQRYVVDATMDNIEFGELIRKEIKDFQSQHNTLDKKEKTND